MKEKETLWVLTELFHPDETSTGYIMTQIALGLSEKFQIKVLTGPAEYSKQETTTKVSYSKKDFLHGIEINRTNNVNLNKNHIVTRFLRLSYISIAIGLKGIFKLKRNAKVLMVTNPVPLLILMSLIAKIKGLKLSLIIHDVYPDNLIAANLVKKDNLFYSILTRLFSFCYNSTSNIIVLGRDMQQLLEQKTSSKINIIENWGQLDSIKPQDKDLKEYNLEAVAGKLTFIFAGNIGRVQGIETLCEVMLKFKGNNQVAFIFAGGGASLAYLKQFVTDNSLSNTHLIGSYKRIDQVKVLNLGDIGVVSLSKNMLGLGVPSKTYNLLAAGKPILYLGDINAEIAQLVSEHDVGWVADITNVASIVNTIEDILKNRETTLLYGSKARKVAEQFYSFPSIIKKYENILIK